jgi:MFS family permease
MAGVTSRGRGGVLPVLQNREFRLYWFGVVFSEIGARGSIAANLYQVYTLSGSVPVTGLVGLAQAVALLMLSPLGGAYADRLDRRRLLQATQASALVVSVALAAVSIAGVASTWEVLVSVILTTAAATFDQPARQALIPALVPESQLPQAFALLNPSRELAVLIGPALAGVLIAVAGPGLMYAVDAGTYAVLIVVLGLMRVRPVVPESSGGSVWDSIRRGAAFVRARPLILWMMSLDLSATLFGAYRVVLPALALDVLHSGPTGYGLLSSAPSAGALLSTFLVIRVVGRVQRLGVVLLCATVAYGLATLLLAQSGTLLVALLGGLVLGGSDSMATTIRHAAVQLETPDHLRGRVSAIYQMSSRGGPALGDLNIGWMAGLLGPVPALTVGALVPVAYAGSLLTGGRVRRYRITPREPEVPAVVVPPGERPVSTVDGAGPPVDGAGQPRPEP